MLLGEALPCLFVHALSVQGGRCGACWGLCSTSVGAELCAGLFAGGPRPIWWPKLGLCVLRPWEMLGPGFGCIAGLLRGNLPAPTSLCVQVWCLLGGLRVEISCAQSARGVACRLQGVGGLEFAFARAALLASVARVPGRSPRPAGVAMDTTRLARLKARADVALSQVSAAKRRLQRANWLAQRRMQRVVDTVAEVAFILCVWSCPDATMAVAYVAAEEGRRQQHFPTLTREALEGRYLETPVDVVGDIWRGAGGCSPARLAEAKRYYRDYGLSAWVGDQNTGKGVAPTPQMVIRRLRATAAAGEPFARAAQRLDRSWASKTWVQRWRHRWGLRFGSFVAREKISAAEKLEKARRSVPERGVRDFATACARGAAKAGPPGGPILGTV